MYFITALDSVGLLVLFAFGRLICAVKVYQRVNENMTWVKIPFNIFGQLCFKGQLDEVDRE